MVVLRHRIPLAGIETLAGSPSRTCRDSVYLLSLLDRLQVAFEQLVGLPLELVSGTWRAMRPDQQ